MTDTSKELRKAFGRFLTGVTVVTARDSGGVPAGFTANSFTSVSLDPPLLLVCPGRHLSRFECFNEATHFGVSVLAEGQQEIANLFAAGKGDRFAACEWDAPALNIPLMSGRAAGFTCEVVQKVPAGDHIVMIGRVVHYDDAGRPGLGYGPDGYFARMQEREAARPAARKTRVMVLLEDGDYVCLTVDGALPGTEIQAHESPLSAARNLLQHEGVAARIGAVYSVWDDDEGKRHLVMRAVVTDPAHGLERKAIAGLSEITTDDPAQDALLRRFAFEHEQQAFGFYYGSAHAGEVLPAVEGD